LAKLLIFGKTFVFDKKLDFWHKFRFLAKLLIFVKNLDFWQNYFGEKLTSNKHN